MTGATARHVRSGLRRVGLIKLAMVVLRKLGYEQLFTKAMQKVTRAGDCVWDIGANIGVYSRMFGELTAPNGRVYAFEPFPETVSRLKGNVSGNPRIKVMPFALSDSPGTATIERGTDEDAATARISDTDTDTDTGNGSGSVRIVLENGDALVRTGQATVPDVIKIDVEGHELEVLRGMRDVLAQQTLKHIFIEVHFAILHADNRSYVPAELERLLRAHGFSLRWVDQSHLHAFRA
jgi:FkbM family methyltransferase